MANAQTNIPVIPVQSPAVSESSSWLDRLWNLPIFNPFRISLLDLQLPSAAIPVPVVSNCSVAPLPEIEDAEAREFEAGIGTEAVVNLDGLTQATARALQRFQGAMSAVGGQITLKSAYRPAAYQEHLQGVWDKWMTLRKNFDEDCQDLKASVEEEFTQHDLLMTQRPVPVSDHTHGIAFDAATVLPARARLNKRRVTLDSLARLSGVQRPAMRRDPVHFILIGGRG